MGLNAHLDVWRWEESATLGVSREGPQSLINGDLDQADIVILVVWSRFGSGTAEEATRAINRALTHGTPRILIYLCRRPIVMPRDVADLRDLQKVIEFRRTIEQIALYKEYENADDIEDMIQVDLARVVKEICSSKFGPLAPEVAAPAADISDAVTEEDQRRESIAPNETPNVAVDDEKQRLGRMPIALLPLLFTVLLGIGTDLVRKSRRVDRRVPDQTSVEPKPPPPDVRKVAFSGDYRVFSGPFRSYQFSPKSNYLAANGPSDTVWVWNAETKQPILVTGQSAAWQFAANESALIVPSKLGFLAYELESHSVRDITTATPNLQGFSSSPDGNSFVWRDDCNAYVTDWKTGIARSIRITSSAPDQPICIKRAEFSSAANSIILTDEKKNVYLVDAEDLSATNHGAFADGQHVELALDPKRFVWSTAKSIMSHDVEWDTEKIIAESPNWGCHGAVSSQGKGVIAAIVDLQFKLTLWTETKDTVMTRSLEDGACIGASISVSHDASKILVANNREAPRLRNLENGAQLGSLRGYPKSIRVPAAAFDPKGKIVAAGSDDGSLRFLEATSGKIILPRIPTSEISRPVSALMFSPDGRLLAVRWKGGEGKIFDVKSGQNIFELCNHDGNLENLFFSPSGQFLVQICNRSHGGYRASDNSILCLLSKNSGLKDACQARSEWIGEPDKAEMVAVRIGLDSRKTIVRSVWTSQGYSHPATAIFSDNEEWFGLAPGRGNFAWIFDTDSWESQKSLDDIGKINALAFAPGGALAATASEKGGIIWDVASRERKKRFAPNNSLTSISFVPMTVSGKFALSVQRRDAQSKNFFRIDGSVADVSELALEPDPEQCVIERNEKFLENCSGGPGVTCLHVTGCGRRPSPSEWWLQTETGKDGLSAVLYSANAALGATTGLWLSVFSAEGGSSWRGYATDRGWLTLQSDGRHECEGSGCLLIGYDDKKTRRIAIGDDPAVLIRRGLAPNFLNADKKASPHD